MDACFASGDAKMPVRRSMLDLRCGDRRAMLELAMRRTSRFDCGFVESEMVLFGRY